MLKIKNLTVKYKGLFALRGLDLEVKESERVGVVGESGSGKTTLCRVIGGIEKNFSGSVLWDKPDKKIQFVFQDAISSLNPRMRIFDIVCEPLRIAGITDKVFLKRVFERTMVEVGLDPNIHMKYPHELSGGERQRVSIARALVVEPDLLICDEPISSLDISLAGQVLNLIDDLQRKFGFALIFVSHDISSVYYLTQKAIVLLRGSVVEEGSTERIIETPLHPYTKLLISSVVSLGRRTSLDFVVKSKVYESRCPFSERCRYICQICEKYEDQFYSYECDHKVKCIRFKEILDEEISC